MDDRVLISLLVIFLLIISYLFGRLQRRPQETTDLDSINLYKEIQGLPAKVLSAIQGSINPQKGKIAELLTYAQIRYDYDVIIPLGQPVDFIGIKNGEKIDFIEVKSGDNSKLTVNEAEIERLIASGKVSFRLLVVKDQELHQESHETNRQ
jgi:hypothetical protein